MCRSEIDKLEEERESVLKDLRLIESRSNEIKDEKNVDKLGGLGRDKCKDIYSNNKLTWSNVSASPPWHSCSFTYLYSSSLFGMIYI